jgi:peroxiredoxin
MTENIAAGILSIVALAASTPSLLRAGPPEVGEKAPDFELATPQGKTVRLSDRLAHGPVVLVVLRGNPGYQCPFCNRQFDDFLRKGNVFADIGANVIMVYPGPAPQLADRATEFIGENTLPAHFDLVLDPDYKFTNLYGLRWMASQETAYPSTFVVSASGIVLFQKVSKEHGGRATAAEVVRVLRQRMPRSGSH